MNSNRKHASEGTEMTNRHLSRHDKGHRPRRRRWAIVLAPPAAAVMFAACGSTHTDNLSPSQRSQAEAPLVTYAKCMRSHGVSDFPEPSIGSLGGIGYSNAQTRAVNRNSSAYQAAQQACQSRPGASTAERLLK
jgi:hypothetical protein